MLQSARGVCFRSGGRGRELRQRTHVGRICDGLGPICGHDKRVKAVPGVALAAQDVGVDAERDLRIGVAELGHHVGHSRPSLEQQGGEGVAQRVRREGLGQRRYVSSLRDELRVGALRGGEENPSADVVAVVGRSAPGAEHEVGGR